MPIYEVRTLVHLNTVIRVEATDEDAAMAEVNGWGPATLLIRLGIDPDAGGLDDDDVADHEALDVAEFVATFAEGDRVEVKIGRRWLPGTVAEVHRFASGVQYRVDVDEWADPDDPGAITGTKAYARNVRRRPAVGALLLDRP